ncbi:PREDICTED: uncharacterized protein LOC106749478 [Dinoponera quadriceps]|uniref:Uncharacterized protein LOC106749478 n=1 Tax=Dinoponera quadriceps TaxID=609295 RepID=A0A6P3Y2C5_DINQU|nr:PREDICTED: uncharacterized protein LOC106749478 [Dinoponera quadriceps]
MSEKKLASGTAAFSQEEYNDYQTYLLSEAEWPGVNVGKDSHVTVNIPMLIMELFRLVPYKENRYVHFHPFNMPHVKVRKIELVGIVMNIRRNVNTLFLTIQDGTGVAQVNYQVEKYASLLKQRKEIDEKYREQARNLRMYKTSTAIQDYPKKFPEIRPNFSYTDNVSFQDKAVLENKWSSETNNGLLGKEIQLLDYVYINGYPCLDGMFQKIPEEGVTTEFTEYARLTVFAVSVTCISEKTYNEKLSMWMNTVICRRYTKK